MPKISHEDFEATKFLGGVAGAKYPFIQKIAMMAPKERLVIAYIEILKKINKNKALLDKLDKDPENEKLLTELFNKIVIPVFQHIGQANYKMGEISHLSAKIGSTRKKFGTHYLPTFKKNKDGDSDE